MPTFGNTVIGGTFSTQNPNFKGVNAAVLTETGTVQKLSAYLQTPAAPTQALRGVIYNDSSGTPGTFVAVTTEVVVAGSSPPAWVDFVFSSPPTIPAATYQIGLWFGSAGGNIRYYFDATATLNYNTTDTYSSSSNPVDPYGAASQASQLMSLYATYTPASTGFSNTVPPTLTGALGVGGTLTINPGTWTPTPASFTYYWHRADNTAGANLVEIGATGATYTLAAGDTSKYIRAGVIPH
jgi:hypothetical protein